MVSAADKISCLHVSVQYISPNDDDVDLIINQLFKNLLKSYCFKVSAENFDVKIFTEFTLRMNELFVLAAHTRVCVSFALVCLFFFLTQVSRIMKTSDGMN